MKKKLLSLFTAVILLLGCAQISYANEYDSFNDTSPVGISPEEVSIEAETTEEELPKDLSEEGFDENDISEDPEPGETGVDAETLIQEEPAAVDSSKKGLLLAESPTSGTVGSISWKISSEGVLALSGSGAIPDFETGFITPWYGFKNDITQVYIGKGITRIGNWAFAYLFTAKSITIPSTVTSIGNSSFFYCASLQSFSIGGNVATVGDSAFQYCTALQNITFKKGVSRIGSSALSSCTALKEITIPITVSSLGDGIFSNCSVLKDIYYRGTKNQWKKIQFNPPDGFYKKVTVHYVNASIKSAEITLSKTSYVYTGTARKPSVTVKYKNKTLKKGTDYKVSYSNNVKAGTAKVKITGIGSYEASVTKSFKITQVKLSSATLNKKYTSVVYTGKAQKPSKKFTVKAKINGIVTKLTYGADYKVTYKNNINVGTATATITGKGNFKGTIKKTFKICPKATSILAPSGKNSTLTAKWKKQTTQTTGYEIQYATNKAFTQNKKSVTVNGSSKTNKEIKNLKTPQKYYVRVRTFKTVSGKKYYSDWSAVKNTYVLAKGMKRNSQNGHFYQLFNTSTTWAEANQKCKSAGGHLVTITTANEQDFIKTLLNSGNKNCYWLGATRSGNTFKWITGERFALSTYVFNNWFAPQQPDNTTEDRLMIYRVAYVYASNQPGQWNDILHDGTCNGQVFFGKNNFGYICEWD